LVPLLGGIKEVSVAVLDGQQQFRESDVVRRYIQAKTHNGGASLTLDEMGSLASYMASQAAKRTPAVGGPDQVAVLANGGVVSFHQPQMPDPPRPLRFTVVQRLKIEGALNFATPPDVHFIFIRSQFVAIKNPRLRLDEQFFYGCEIRDSIVEYGGSLTDFGPTNTVVNTMILPGYRKGPGSTTEMLRIMNAFNWTDKPPETPQLPPTVSPLPD
jgi:hypothetical protein